MGKSRHKDGPLFIDLFAGCGGLSLGLEQAGWVPAFVNELSPDARSSYLLNRVGDGAPEPFRHDHLAELNEADVTDMTSKWSIRGVKAAIEEHFGDRPITAVVGGPPCQGYSGIGHRRTFSDLKKEDLPTNHLYKEMIKVIEGFQPDLFLFENVKGLLSGRWTPSGEKGEIWEDVRTAFEAISGYQTGWSLVQAKEYGVPQNRPRVLLVGVHERMGYTPNILMRADGLLPEPFTDVRAPDPIDLLGDLIDPDYRATGVTPAYPAKAMSAIQRQLRTVPGQPVSRKGAPLTEHEYSAHGPKIVEKFAYMIEHKGVIPEHFKTKKFAQRVIPERWGEGGPSITATSLPDDYVHFKQPRSLTVREWARLQTFPDWYQFGGKRTTGGRRRAGDPSTGDWSRETPKYTQIGNAVPVNLAEALGNHFRSILQV